MTSLAQSPTPQLQSWLQQLSQHAEPQIAAQARVFLEQQELAAKRQTEKYRLLHSFGLANDQLVKFANFEGYSEANLQALLMAVLAVDAEAAVAISRQV